MEIKENMTLQMKNVLSFRGRMSQQEMVQKSQEIEQVMKDKGVVKAGPTATTTFSVEQSPAGPVMDIEILIPVDKGIEAPAGYTFKPEILLVNALMANSDGSSIIMSRDRKVYKGKQVNEAKKIVILISRKTGSAADEFVHITKGQKNAVIIGNNTGGEGLMGTFAADVCPNSRLVFVYMPSKVLDDKENDYSTKGTAPDIYVSDSLDDYKESKDAALEEAINYLDEH